MAHPSRSSDRCIANPDVLPDLAHPSIGLPFGSSSGQSSRRSRQEQPAIRAIYRVKQLNFQVLNSMKAMQQQPIATGQW